MLKNVSHHREMSDGIRNTVQLCSVYKLYISLWFMMFQYAPQLITYSVYSTTIMLVLCITALWISGDIDALHQLSLVKTIYWKMLATIGKCQMALETPYSYVPYINYIYHNGLQYNYLVNSLQTIILLNIRSSWKFNINFFAVNLSQFNEITLFSSSLSICL